MTIEKYHARFTGAWVARCIECGKRWALWDDDGDLVCPCTETVLHPCSTLQATNKQRRK